MSETTPRVSPVAPRPGEKVEVTAEGRRIVDPASIVFSVEAKKHLDNILDLATNEVESLRAQLREANERADAAERRLREYDAVTVDDATMLRVIRERDALRARLDVLTADKLNVLNAWHQALVAEEFGPGRASGQPHVSLARIREAWNRYRELDSAAADVPTPATETEVMPPGPDDTDAVRPAAVTGAAHPTHAEFHAPTFEETLKMLWECGVLMRVTTAGNIVYYRALDSTILHDDLRELVRRAMDSTDNPTKTE